MVLPYSSTGRVIALNVWMIVSLFFPHVVPVSALYMFVVLAVFVFVILVCSAKLSLGSRVIPSILGFLFVSRIWLFIVSCSFLEYSAGSGVKSVVWVLFVFRCRLLISAQCTMLVR